MNPPAASHRRSSAASPTVDDGSSTLLGRRAELLEGRRNGSLTREQSVELDELTVEVTRLMAAGSFAVRRLEFERDHRMLLRLAPLEPVHPFVDPTDEAEIRSRTDGPRHCYVLENSSFEGHPINVVWVALVDSLPSGMHDVLGPGAKYHQLPDPTTAVFYSIWNVEKGLAGAEGGSSLISLVTAHLKQRYPTIRTYTTLSPIPGFRTWLDETEPELSQRLDGFGPVDADPNTPTAAQGTETRVPDESLAATLAGSCGRYLLTMDERNLPIDDVARFHMRNGARLWRLVPDGDRSTRGWQRSWGMMVNYRYSPENLEENRAGLLSGNPAIGDQPTAMIDGAPS